MAALAVVAFVAGAATRAQADAHLLIEADTGKVLHADNATQPWYPASVTKLMTAYSTLRAIKEGRMSMDSLLTVSKNAVAQQPVKMGFKAGTQLTVDNALKMVMVKSANDMAVVIAEGVGGSIEGFADLMNVNARRLGMTQSNFVNPNGLPAEEQVTSARDLAILARALLREFPEYEYLWHIHSIRLGKRVIRNYNSLLDRYPGADGMKTGFICASGYNLVASATRDGKRLIAVVLGSRGGGVRAQKAAQLLERGFQAGRLSWLKPSLGTVDALVPVANATPPNMREDVCGKNRKRPASEDNDEDEEETTVAGTGENADGTGEGMPQRALSLQALKPAYTKYVLPAAGSIPAPPPVEVYLGPKRRPGEAAPDPEMAIAANPKAKAVGQKKANAKAAAVKTADKPAAEKSAAAKSKAKPAATAEAKAKTDAKPKADAKPETKSAAAKTPAAKPAAAKTAAAPKPAAQ